MAGRDARHCIPFVVSWGGEPVNVGVGGLVYGVSWLNPLTGSRDR